MAYKGGDFDERLVEASFIIIAHWDDWVAKERLLGETNLPDREPLDIFTGLDSWKNDVDMCTSNMELDQSEDDRRA